MKRRDFVKAFTTVSAAVPVATSLASIQNAEKVIETFEPKIIIPKKEPFLGDMTFYKKSIFEDVGIYEWGCLILLGPSISRRSAITLILDSLIDTNVRLSPAKIHIIDKYEHLMGYRGLNIISLGEYWHNSNFNWIAKQLYAREMNILHFQNVLNALKKE